MESEAGETDALLPHTENNNDEDDRANAAQKLQPEAPSTPGASGEQTEMTAMNRPPERGPHTAETSFIKGPSSGRVWSSDTLKIKLANELANKE